MKVLIADDEKLARERLVRMVGMLEDYEVIGEAASGQEAILRTTELQPDIVESWQRSGELTAPEKT